MIDVRKAEFIPGGFLESWLQYTEPYEFPESYGVFSLLTCASAAISGRILVNPDSEPSVMPNIYTLLVGPSGARKGTAMKQAVWLLGDAVPEVAVLPRSFTVEIAKIRLAKVSAEEGKACGLIIADEFSDLIGGAKYKEGATKFLTDIWDCPPVYAHDTVAHDYMEILRPYVTGMWCSSNDWLETLDPKLLSGGFLRRVLEIVEYRARQHNDAPKRNMALFAALSMRFREVLGPGAFEDGISMRLTPEAVEAKRRWYHDVVPKFHGRGEKEGHFASCMEAHALKVAACMHILEGGDPRWLSAPALEISQRLIEQIVEPMFQLYAGLAPTPFARLKASVLRLLSASKGEMSEWGLARAVQAATGAKPAEYAMALEALLADRAVKRDGGKVWRV